MQVFEGLFFYELILLILGVILFITMLIILIIFAVKGKSFKGLLAFFILPIVMIGFPGYQKITFDNGVITAEKYARQLNENPADNTLRNKLQETMNNIENRPVSEPSTLLKLSKATLTLGDTVKAIRLAEDVLEKKPDSQDARQLIKENSTPRVQLEKSIYELKENPDNLSIRNSLKKDLINLSDSTRKNALTYETIANGHLILGDTTKALHFIDSALKIRPDLNKAKELRRRIISKRVQ
jgi:tetratricopeptide (TPR) repeat protein